jgi:lactoylglutathione lyase
VREELLSKAIHSMIRVLDLERSIAFYREALGLEVADRIEFDQFTLVYLRNDESEFELELTANTGTTVPYEQGTAYGHLAASVEDVRAEHARLEAAGLSPEQVKEMNHEGELLGRYFFLSDPDGYRVEVLERGGRFR